MQSPNTIGIFIFSLILAYSSSYLLNPFIRDLGFKYGFVDVPNYRKQHKKLKVRIGGISIITSCFFSFLAFLGLNLFLGNEILAFNSLSFLLAGGLFYFVIGILDDIYSISPWPRLFLQIFIAYFIFSKSIDLNIFNFDYFFFNHISNNYSDYLNSFLLVFYIVGFTNSINWIDGLDGLAAGISTIAAFGLAVLALLLGQYLLAVFLTILAFSSLGFLKMNSYPSKIMMGDGGTYFLGFTLSSASLILVNDSQEQINLISPLIIFAIPIIDMFIVILKRIISGRSPFYPDRNHIHHRLLKTGLSQKKIVYLIYFFAIIQVIISVITLFSKNNFIFLFFPISFLVLSLTLSPKNN